MEFSYTGDLPIFSHLIIYSIYYFYQYALRGIYAILSHNIVLFHFNFAHIIPALAIRALSVCSYTLLVGPYISVWFCLFDHILTLWYHKMLQAHLVYFLPESLESAISLRNPGVFYRRVVLETKIGVLDVLMLPGCGCF